MIRCAGVEDIPAIIEMVGQYRCEVRPDLEMHPGTVAASVRGLITQPTGCALLACDGGACRGVLLGHLGASLWWPDPSAEVALWWVDPRWRGTAAATRLMAEFEAWAARSGAARIGVTYTGKSARRYFERRGYRHADTRMMKELN
tara:strand:- start:1570 stop:2004 length:435 start_codon:yes stop_codon:yes gene_type:complete